ncbi:MAG: glutamate mutase L, partial [Acidimicrobiales bacterium]
MNAAVLTDFGSTICKVTVVDLDDGVVVGHGEAPTFLGADVMEGHDAAYDAATSHLSRRPDVVVRLASSSAGGGLRMAVVGMVDAMTTAAGERAALNAGARLELVLHGQLTELDVEAIDEVDPEIILFSGGTDGGQRELVLQNARMLASGSFAAHVIVACNRDVSQEVADVLTEESKSAYVVANVMPRIGTVQLGEVREAILSIFLKHVIRGKKLSERPSFLESVVTATPDAAMCATRLLA